MRVILLAIHLNLLYYQNFIDHVSRALTNQTLSHVTNGNESLSHLAKAFGVESCSGEGSCTKWFPTGVKRLPTISVNIGDGGSEKKHVSNTNFEKE